MRVCCRDLEPTTGDVVRMLLVIGSNSSQIQSRVSFPQNNALSPPSVYVSAIQRAAFRVSPFPCDSYSYQIRAVSTKVSLLTAVYLNFDVPSFRVWYTNDLTRRVLVRVVYSVQYVVVIRVV